jgi:hypothetical protein
VCVWGGEVRVGRKLLSADSGASLAACLGRITAATDENQDVCVVGNP